MPTIDNLTTLASGALADTDIVYVGIPGDADPDRRMVVSELRDGLIESGTTAARPSSPATGEMYFDTTLGKPVWYDGSGWVDATGTTA